MNEKHVKRLWLILLTVHFSHLKYKSECIMHYSALRWNSLLNLLANSMSSGVFLAYRFALFSQYNLGNIKYDNTNMLFQYDLTK